MKEATEQPQIELEQIKELADIISQLNSKDDEGVCLCYEDCQTIETALKVLPKLVEALIYSNRMLKQASKRLMDEDFYDYNFIATQLDLFTNQTPQQ